MNRIALALLAAGLVAPAYAADLVVDVPVVEPVSAPSSFYASIFAGVALADSETTFTPDGSPVGFTTSIDYDAGFILGGALGMSVYENLRGEIEVSYYSASVEDGVLAPPGIELTSSTFSVFGNLWYDFVNDTSFTPYLGAGLGYGYNEITEDDFSIETKGLRYQLGAGVKYDVADNIALDLGYRYRTFVDAAVTFDGEALPGVDITSDATTHIFQAGLTFGF